MSALNLSSLAVRERSVTLFLLLASVLGGLYAFTSLGRAEDPSFTVRVLLVNVAWPGASVEELENQVVDGLERRIQEVESLRRIETTIRPGQATLQVEFEDFVPEERVAALFYEVRKRMWDEAANMPPGVIGPLVDDDFDDVYFSLIALSANGLPSPMFLREAEALRDRAQRLPGMQKAVLIGERPERIYVEFDNARLVNLGFAPERIFAAIEAANRVLPAGRLETLGPRLHLRLDHDVAELQSIEALPIRIDDRVLRLADIATVRRGEESPARLRVRAQGNDALLVGLVMARGEDGLALGRTLDTFAEAVRGELPLGMSLTVLTNQAEAIDQAVNLFQGKFLAALAVVLGVSMLAIGLRAGLIVGISVPVTLGITFLFMLALDINLDRITLGALILALGLLVDDAIIAVEMMLVKLDEGWDRVRAAAHAWTVTASPMLFGTLVTAAGFLPIGFAQSGVGEYTGNIFWVLGISLLISWLVAVVFVPYLGVSMLREKNSIAESTQREHSHGAYDAPMYRRLRSLIAACVRWRKSVIAGTVALLALAILGMATQVEQQFFPGSDRPEVLISVQLPQGSSIEATDTVVSELESLLANSPDIRSLSAFVGAGIPRFFISANPEPPDPAFAKLLVVTRDIAARERVLAQINSRIEAGDFPQARVRPQALLFGPPVNWPVEFRLLGPDPSVLRRLGREVRQVMSAHPAVVNPHLEWDERMPVARLVADPQRLRLLGLTPESLAQQLQFQIEGRPVTALRRGTRSVELVARGTGDGDALDAARLESLELLNEDGQALALSQIGRIELAWEEPLITRYTRERSLALRADVRDAQPNDVSSELWDALESLRASLPAGYRLEVAGAVGESARADASIQALMPLMVAVMLLLIMLQMRSFTGSLVVVATAPLGLIGAALALIVFRQPFGFVALLGLIGLAGILMRNTLILAQQVSDNLAHGHSSADAVIEAAVQRARPVLLTAVAAILAFIPLALDIFWGPLAYVLIGGLAVGTVITLLFVPALYAALFRVAGT